MTIQIILLLLIILIGIWSSGWPFGIKQFFDTLSGYNQDSDLLMNKIQVVSDDYITQNRNFQSLLDNSNKANPQFNNDDMFKLPIPSTNTSGPNGIYAVKEILDKTGYNLYNKNIDFPLDSIFKKTIMDYFITNGIFKKDEKVYIMGKLENIYFKDT